MLNWPRGELARSWITCMLGVVAFALQLPALAYAQTPFPAVPPAGVQLDSTSTEQAEIVRRLQESGITRSQLRSRLMQMGYNPGLADRYFDAIDGNAPPPTGSASPDFMRALEQAGLFGTAADTIPLLSDSLAALPVDPGCELSAPGGLPIFGRDLFCRATTQFQPVTAGPVDPDYRLGPGDQLSLVLTGDLETAYLLDVSREGYIFIPDVGQVAVNGLTLRELEDRLYGRLGSVYSGVTRAAGATTFFQVSVGRVRTIQVFLIGEVERPGAYQISSLATVFNALYQARGPNRGGSFRNIEVRRGGDVVQTVDLYNYLLRGDNQQDIRLEQGDAIFVPFAGPQVSIQGSVRRGAVFEMRPQEGLEDLLAFAGLRADAQMRRVQIDRILPAGARGAGVDRTLLDVDLATLFADDESRFTLMDGDAVQVFGVSEERRNRLTVVGEVRRPGLLEWFPGMTLQDAVERSDGLADQAFTARAHVFRLNPEDGSRRLISASLLSDSGPAGQDVPLADRDSIVIYSRGELREPRTVTITGLVRVPGVYPLADEMTVRDLILAAGGLLEGADGLAAEVARRAEPSVRSDTTAVIYEVALGLPSPGVGDVATTALALEQAWVPTGNEFGLVDGDQVFVRRLPGFVDLGSVHLDGFVLQPGDYVLERRQERLVDLLGRAGGFAPEAYLEGLRLTRGGQLVATDLTRALQDPESRFNVVLEAGDSIYLPDYDPTVLVTGAVGFESRVLYVPGQGVEYYINRAGGLTERADGDRLSVTYADGSRASAGRRLFVRTMPRPEPGSTIFVPNAPAEAMDGVDWDQLLTRTLSIVSTTVTILLAVDRLGGT